MIISDREQHAITNIVLPAPHFEGGEEIAMQQGIGMGIIQGNKKRVEASVQFLKWLTSYEENAQFALSAAYLPVRVASFTVEAIDKEKGSGMDPSLEKALSTMSSNTLYFTPSIINLAEIRKALEYELQDKALSDRYKIETAMASGVAREDAIAEYDNDENFEQYYETLTEEINYLLSDS